MYQGKTVSVIIPTYNEEGSIARVIEDFFATGVVDEVVAVDNNARGNTAAEIRKTRARHIEEKEHQGYGHALMRGMREATGDLLVMVEADGTFEARDIHKFLEYSQDFDVVFGTRTSRAAIWSGAFMPFPVRFGNWFVAKFLEVLHNGPTMTDVGCTYKLISRKALEAIRDLFLRSPGDGTFSPELMIWLIRRGFKPIEIPVNFKPRVGDSMYTGSIWKAAVLGARMMVRIAGYRLVKL
jgi:glycosyltransferase involved in cell wall biosynthesis